MNVSSSYDMHVSSSSSELCFRGTELWSHRHDFQLKDQLLSMPLFTYMNTDVDACACLRGIALLLVLLVLPLSPLSPL